MNSFEADTFVAPFSSPHPASDVLVTVVFVHAKEKISTFINYRSEIMTCPGANVVTQC